MQPARVIDLHQDLLPYIEGAPLLIADGGGRQTSLELIAGSPLRVVIATSFPLRAAGEALDDPGMLARIEQLFERYNALAAADPRFMLVRSRAELETALESENPRGLLLAIEGLPLERYDQDWLERVYARGWRWLGPVWDSGSALAGGASEPERGLSQLGERVLGWCSEHRIGIDLAHTSERSFDQIIALSAGPVCVSHANARALCDHPRNLSDLQLQALAGRESLIGLVPYPRFVGGEVPSVERLAEHAAYIASICGSERLALGSDFGGLIDQCLPGLAGVSELGTLWEALERRGFSTLELNGIAWRNAARFLSRVLP